jgi:LAS superfamily LD-carboxypeptidase LdcB
VWTASNGRIPPRDLATIPWSGGDRVRADVVDGLQRLDAAFAAAFGRHLSVTSAYRTHAQQESLYDPASKIAAPPGCSNHGTGLAVDLGGGVQTFGSTEYDWLKAHAPAYGWVHPPFAEPGGRNPEPWHWQSVRAPNSR